jgi:Family of unknown function (DUF6527)
MITHTPLAHEFVEYIPAELAEGVLYLSIPFRTAVHRCACGCGNKVVTPISPADWQLFYDGDTVSLTPSIGNWGFPCRSHYWIDTNEIQWAKDWTDKQIAAGRARDDHDRAQYFAARTAGATTSRPPYPAHSHSRAPGFQPHWQSWVTKLFSRLNLRQDSHEGSG